MTPTPHSRRARWWPAALAVLSLNAWHAGAQAQAAMAGSYGNFDVLNNTGGPTCGFEMEVSGITKSHLTRIFPSNFDASVIRYGFGTAIDIAGGVIVRWASPYDAVSGRFTTCTPVPVSRTTVPGDSCWRLGMPGTYDTAGCEHFGISSTANPTKIVYRWLVPDAANPGSLKASPAPLDLPMPYWSVVQPANPALPPVVVAEVPAPPPPAPAVFGNAQWVRVYKRELPAKVGLVELMGDNHAIVPENPAELEVSWSLLQQDPPDGGRQRRRGKLVNQGNLGNGAHAVVRRYEYYTYAGVYDPITHEALCADLTCTAPSPGELGEAIGAQNAAANLDVNALTVSIAGGGSVSSGDKVVSCGSKCYGVYAPGASVTLTAKANSGSTFSMWGGACAGNAATCTVLMNAESAVTATFTAVAGGGGGGGGAGATSYTLSVSTSNPGTVTSVPAGIDCGKTCSAKLPAGSALTLTAIPPLGKAFVGWTGACSGTAPTCSLTINADTKAQASFTK